MINVDTLTTTKQFESKAVRLMITSGILRNSRSWHDYERAKDVIARLSFDPNTYERCIRVASDYVGV